MPFDLWLFNKHRRIKMRTVETLEDITNSSFTIENNVVEGNKKAKKELQTALPIELDLLEPIAQDVRPDYKKGYDDVFKRIDFDVIKNATKKIENETVPAFAYYNIFQRNAECRRKFSVTAYEEPNEQSLKFIKYNNVLRNIRNFYEGADFGGLLSVFVVSLLFNCGWMALEASALWAKLLFCSVGFVGSLMSLFSIVGGFFLGDKKITKTFTHKFEGLIPEETREIIKNYRGKFEKILLVEEAHNWKITETEEIIKAEKNPDPLVIGCYDNTYWLITKFDVTPLENLIATEFTA